MSLGEGWNRFVETTEDEYVENDDYFDYEGDELTAENISVDSEAMFYEE